jgi:hypothetical protein
VHAPNADVRQGGPYIGTGRGGWNVELRCPTPRTIPPRAEVEFSTDTCAITTYEPGPGGIVTSYRLVAREGYQYSGLEPGYPIERSVK